MIQWSFGDMTPDQLADHNSLVGRNRGETIDIRNRYYRARRSGKSHADAMRAARTDG